MVVTVRGVLLVVDRREEVGVHVRVHGWAGRDGCEEKEGRYGRGVGSGRVR